LEPAGASSYYHPFNLDEIFNNYYIPIIFQVANDAIKDLKLDPKTTMLAQGLCIDRIRLNSQSPANILMLDTV
jgi:hypothetical protein